MNQPTEATVLIPAKNEAASIGDVVSRVRTLLPGAQVLVVDDGSRDATAQQARSAGAEVVEHATSRGKGAALRTGFANARGTYIVTLDADGQDAPEDIVSLLEAGRAGADLVIGSRFLGTFSPGAITWPNYLATRAFNVLIYARYGTRVTDSQAGVRCYRRSFFQRLTWYSREFEVETELLVAALSAGGNIVEVPVRRMPRAYGASSFKRIRHGMRILRTILAGRAP